MGKQNQLQLSLDASNAELTQLQASQRQPLDPGASGEVENQMRKLREELVQAQQDAGNLRTSASINASLANAPAEEGSKSVAEQVAEHVEEVRKELERRHDERVKQNDEDYQRRVEGMKGMLNKRLAEVRAQIRQAVTAENAQALQALQSQHEQTLQALRSQHQQDTEGLLARHKDELAELQRTEDSRISKLKAGWDSEHQAQSTDKDSSKPIEVTATRGEWQPTEEEARAFVSSNETVKAIVKRNITQHVSKAKEDLATRLREEHEKAVSERLVDAESKAETAKKHAVMMEGKKTALQVNMANNKARISQFKLDIVQKAAHDTPRKAVQEVWAVVKDAKPPTQAPATQSQQQAAKNAATSGTASGQPTPAPQGSQPDTSTAQSKPTQATSQGPPSGISTFGRPTPAAPAPQAQPVKTQQGQDSNPPPNSSNTNQPPTQTGLNPPQVQPQGPSNNHHPNAGTGPGALRGLQSGLPVARGGSNRGGPARGRGSGIARVGPGIDTNRAQGSQQRRASPTSATMNAGAKQFVPGNKRPREGSQDGGSDGKRIRGGGGGGRGA